MQAGGFGADSGLVDWQQTAGSETSSEKSGDVPQLHDTGKRNGQPGQPKPGQPRAPIAAGLPKPVVPSPITEHAKEIMLELVRHRANYTAEAVAAESFKLARAFAAEAAKEKPGESSDG